jgi:hypothetical protein
MPGYHGWDGYRDAFFAGDDVFYGHVLGFKGLERPVVVLAVNGIRDQSRSREYLYVGLSRARTCLVVCGDLDQSPQQAGKAYAGGSAPADSRTAAPEPPNGSLLITDVEVQAAACRDRVDQGLQVRRRGRLRPCLPPARQHDPGGKPGTYRAQRPRPGRCRRRDGGARPPSLRGRATAAVAQSTAAGDQRTRRPSRSRTRS